MMDIIVKGINIRLVGTAIGELVYMAVKSNHMIDKDQIQDNIGIHQTTLIIHSTLISMIVTVKEFIISVGMA